MADRTLAELCDSVQSAVETFVHRERTAAQIEQLTELEGRVASLLVEVKQTTTAISNAASAGLVVEWQTASALSKRATALAAKARSGSPEREATDSLHQELLLASKHTSTRLEDRWKAFVREQVPTGEGLRNLLGAFQAATDAQRTIREIGELLGQVNRIADQPPSADAATRLRSHAENLPRLLVSLVGDDVSVRRFVELVAKGGAPISAITPGVAAWLREKNHDGTFKVVPGAPAKDDS